MTQIPLESERWSRPAAASARLREDPVGGVLGTKGTTLSETLVTVSLLGVLTAVAIPDWGSLLPSLRLDGGTRQIQSELHRIKMKAVSENVSYQLVLTQGGNNYTVRSGGVNLETTALPTGIETQGTLTVEFTSRGTPSSSSTTSVKLCNANSKGKNILVSATGKIRTCTAVSCNGDCQ